MSNPLPPGDWEKIMDADAIRRAVRRIASQVVEDVPDLAKLVIVGIPRRGLAFAKRLAAAIAESEGKTVEVGALDISMHRDDLRHRPNIPEVWETELPVDLDCREVLLADDVYFTGRTCRAALDAMHSFGRPPRIRYAVLIDRPHAELPIRPDYIGRHLPTKREERVAVRFAGEDGEEEGVWIKRAE
jgi:pyrimidine operon attenuation protein/uracil phosphoribosyltransferase